MSFPRLRRWLLLATLGLLAGCPDNGHHLNVCDNPELQCDDSNACTLDSCDPTDGCLHQPRSCTDADVCTLDRCDPIAGCVNAPVSCDDGNRCTSDRCDQTNGCTNADISASCNDQNACTTDRCEPTLGCVNALILCDDGNACTAEGCSSSSGCFSQPVADGTSCDRGLGRCRAGQCEPIGCSRDADCNDQDACTSDRCNLDTHECVNSDISSQCNDSNACTADRCVAATGCVYDDISATCDDGEECTADACVPATGCTAQPVDDGTPCEDGVCRAARCVSALVVEYEQSFEGLDRMKVSALADDGWVVYGNVFDASTGAFIYGYGPFAAPNSGAAFCAIASGQGGAAQGEQQLSIYSDYNNTDHALGQRIESNTYRERSIGAADAGRTVRFRFDAKRGNINDPSDPLCPCTSMARAFLKTLDPMAGFATTNLVDIDTTNLSSEWTSLELSLPIGENLVGQLIQVGFATNATLYQPSGNFYDNVRVSSIPTPP